MDLKKDRQTTLCHPLICIALKTVSELSEIWKHNFEIFEARSAAQCLWMAHFVRESHANRILKMSAWNSEKPLGGPCITRVFGIWVIFSCIFWASPPETFFKDNPRCSTGEVLMAWQDPNKVPIKAFYEGVTNVPWQQVGTRHPKSSKSKSTCTSLPLDAWDSSFFWGELHVHLELWPTPSRAALLVRDLVSLDAPLRRQGREKKNLYWWNYRDQGFSDFGYFTNSSPFWRERTAHLSQKSLPPGGPGALYCSISPDGSLRWERGTGSPSWCWDD